MIVIPYAFPPNVSNKNPPILFFTALGVQWEAFNPSDKASSQQTLFNFAQSGVEGNYTLGFMDVGTCAIVRENPDVFISSPFGVLKTNVIINVAVFGSLILILIVITKVNYRTASVLCDLPRSQFGRFASRLDGS